ncbi:MAG: hypothetical protein AAF957_26525 [Planctomycetota bacterium]
MEPHAIPASEGKRGCNLRPLGCLGALIVAFALFLAVASFQGRWVAERTSFADVELLHAASGGSFELGFHKDPVASTIWGYSAVFVLDLRDGSGTSWITPPIAVPGDWEERLDGLAADLGVEERDRRRREFIDALESTWVDPDGVAPAGLGAMIASHAVRMGHLRRTTRQR